MGENAANAPFGGFFVYVETKDKANNVNSVMWEKKVEALGGKVVNKVTDKVTHVVFRGGKKTVRAGLSSRAIISGPPTVPSCLCSRVAPRPSLPWRGRPGTRPSARAFPWWTQGG